MKKKVYVSSGFYKNENPVDTLKNFIKNKIHDIELSGGNYINKKQINEIRLLNKKKSKIRIHNYFPPPKSKFVINFFPTSLKNLIYFALSLYLRLRTSIFTFFGVFFDI